MFRCINEYNPGAEERWRNGTLRKEQDGNLPFPLSHSFPSFLCIFFLISAPPHLPTFFFSLCDSICSIAYLFFLSLLYTLHILWSFFPYSLCSSYFLSETKWHYVFFFISYSFSSNLFWWKISLLPLNDFFIPLPSYSLGLPPSPFPL